MKRLSLLPFTLLLAFGCFGAYETIERQSNLSLGLCDSSRSLVETNFRSFPMLWDPAIDERTPTNFAA